MPGDAAITANQPIGSTYDVNQKVKKTFAQFAEFQSA